MVRISLQLQFHNAEEQYERICLRCRLQKKKRQIDIDNDTKNVL